MFSDKYRLIFIAEHRDPEFSDKYRLIFIAAHRVPMFSDKYRLIFIADIGTQSSAINIG